MLLINTFGTFRSMSFLRWSLFLAALLCLDHAFAQVGSANNSSPVQSDVHTERSNYVDFLLAIIKPEINDIERIQIKWAETPDAIVRIDATAVVMELHVRFWIGEPTLAELASSVYFRALEKFIEPIAVRHGLEYSPDWNSIGHPTNNPSLYSHITSGKLTPWESRTLSERYLRTNTIPFFKEASSVAGIGNRIRNLGVKEIVNGGMSGAYPVNVLKAITISKWCGNDAKVLELERELRAWIVEDRADPKRSKMANSYEAALDELMEKLGASGK